MGNSLEEISGRFDRVKWSNEETSFFIGLLDDGTTVKGNCIGGEYPIHQMTYRFSGKWKSHPKYGVSFEFQAYVMDTPKDRSSVIVYLTKKLKGMGVGTVRAAKLVDHFGPEEVIAVLKHSPDRISEAVPRISQENREKISEKLKSCEEFESTVLELTNLFHGRGFHQQTIELAVEKWKVLAPTVVRKDPFKLLTSRFPGAGFARVDTLYKDLGHSPDKMKRQVLCIWHYMKTDMSGSVWFHILDLKRHLEENVSSRNVDIVRALKVGIRARWFGYKNVDGQHWVSVYGDAYNEEVIAKCLAIMTVDIEEGGSKCGLVQTI